MSAGSRRGRSAEGSAPPARLDDVAPNIAAQLRADAPAESHSPTDSVQSSANAEPVTSEPTEIGTGIANVTVEQSSTTSVGTLRSAGAGSVPTVSGSDSTSPTSKPSDKPSARWKPPRNAREFAAQANRVATMILNGEIEEDTARTYSAVARTAAQMLTAEVQRARFLQAEPNLSLEDDSSGTITDNEERE